MSSTAVLPVAVIGAGPVGLAAAAHLIERGETPIVFEQGASIGSSVRQWGHVRMFSPWEFTVDSASVRLLEATGWQMPPKDHLPTGDELLDQYLLPFAQLPSIRDRIHLNARVVAVSRRDIDKMKDAGRDDAPFVLHVAYADGNEALIEARAVIDATGTWTQPNPLGAGGLPAIGEKRHAAHIAYGIPDVRGAQRARYADKRVLVVGSGHSAINALLELVALSDDAPLTEIVWAMRSDNLRRVYGGGEDDALAARGQLGTRIRAAVEAGIVHIVSPFRIREIPASEHSLTVIGDTPDGIQMVEVDEIISATGARPDLDMLRELRLDIDSSLESTRTLAPMIDPNIHSCGTVRPHGEAELRQPERDFYIVGMKSYGRAPTFLLATGYEQVRSVVAALAGDWDAARDVQLNLPETGVCSTDLVDGGGACCSTPSVSVQPVLLSLISIPVHGLALTPVALDVAVSDCGCDDACCSDCVRSQTCGCDSTCCS
ncbi:MAG: NAD(P)-binding domain-containing protein [Chloroflexota bacterium]|nr:NAD(P)-binding domain-containing protein [Chloroflexota bacterium]